MLEMRWEKTGTTHYGFPGKNLQKELARSSSNAKEGERRLKKPKIGLIKGELGSVWGENCVERIILPILIDTPWLP